MVTQTQTRMRWPLLLCAAGLFLTNCKWSALAMPPADEARDLASMDLDSAPVFDGMAAAYGRIYVTTADGQVLCLAGDRQVTW